MSKEKENWAQYMKCKTCGYIGEESHLCTPLLVEKIKQKDAEIESLKQQIELMEWIKKELMNK